jgi:dTDP-4-dehydrorhamnose 3,5-epimerase-like enzyme
MAPCEGTTLFGGRVRAFSLPAIDDGGASLLPIELADVPMTAVRSFLVTAPSGTVRGGHGHRSGCQLLVRISGEIELELAVDDETATLVLDGEQNAAVIHSPVWARQTYRGESPQLMVLCDTPYDPDSYICEHPAAT